PRRPRNCSTAAPRSAARDGTIPVSCGCWSTWPGIRSRKGSSEKKPLTLSLFPRAGRGNDAEASALSRRCSRKIAAALPLPLAGRGPGVGGCDSVEIDDLDPVGHLAHRVLLLRRKRAVGADRIDRHPVRVEPDREQEPAARLDLETARGRLGRPLAEPRQGAA